MGFFDKLIFFCFVSLRVKKYRLLSDCKRVFAKSKIKLYHPLLMKGEGQIKIGYNLQNGVINSPNYYSHYSYLEVRNEDSEIIIGNDVAINNSFSAVAYSKIIIDDNVIIGVNCSIMDSDGHFLKSDMRNTLNPPSMQVHIKQNVFLGDNVTVLKGVTIGENSVIANGSIVTKDIPANIIAGGVPAKVIKMLER